MVMLRQIPVTKIHIGMLRVHLLNRLCQLHFTTVHNDIFGFKGLIYLFRRGGRRPQSVFSQCQEKWFPYNTRAAEHNTRYSPEGKRVLVKIERSWEKEYNLAHKNFYFTSSHEDSRFIPNAIPNIPNNVQENIPIVSWSSRRRRRFRWLKFRTG